MYDAAEDLDTGLAASVVFADSAVLQVVNHFEVDLEPYGDAKLSDAALLEHAHTELLAEQSRRIRVLAGGDRNEVGPVLGSCQHAVAAADQLDEVLDEVDTVLDRFPNVTDTVLESAIVLGQLRCPARWHVRGERRAAARELRTQRGAA